MHRSGSAASNASWRSFRADFGSGLAGQAKRDDIGEYGNAGCSSARSTHGVSYSERTSCSGVSGVSLSFFDLMERKRYTIARRTSGQNEPKIFLNSWCIARWDIVNGRFSARRSSVSGEAV